MVFTYNVKKNTSSRGEKVFFSIGKKTFVLPMEKKEYMNLPCRLIFPLERKREPSYREEYINLQRRKEGFFTEYC